MAAPLLTLVLLFVSCFSLATWVGPRFDQLSARNDQGLMANMFGGSRKLFANHFFTRSDVYFHSGYYPTIFDRLGGKKENHLAESAGAEEAKHSAHDEHEEEEENFLGQPKDPMDAFSRHFFVSRHSHLTDKGANAPKEILPWLKLAAQVDPTKVESYTVGAFWLRELNKPDEAEQFLREGFRHNPQHSRTRHFPLARAGKSQTGRATEPFRRRANPELPRARGRPDRKPRARNQLAHDCKEALTASRRNRQAHC